MARVNLTEHRIKALTPDPTGKRRELRDAVVPGLIVRVAARRKSYMLHTRFPGSHNPTRRSIGEVGAISLDDARATARAWLELVRQGRDPAAEVKVRKDEARRAREAERVQEEGQFARVAEDYLHRKVVGQRGADVVGRIVGNVLVPAWGDKPIPEISRRDVIHLIEQINDRGAPIYAHAVFGVVRAMFNWCIARDVYGVERSPCDRMRVRDFLSRQKEPRQRTLGDPEILALWKASGRLGYPYGPLFRLLLLTGTRKTEAAGARWAEFDLERRIWTVPPERFTSNVSHLVPLTQDVVALLAALPRFKRGDHLFSFSFGERPVATLHGGKERLDTLMLRNLRAQARLRGDDPATTALTPWQTHDLRRVVRTRLAGLEVNDTLAEMILGHGKRGLQRVYDQSARIEPTRRALEAWASELRRIVTRPATSNVVRLSR